MPKPVNEPRRRRLLKLAALGTGGWLGSGKAAVAAPSSTGGLSLSPGGRDFSPANGAERTAVPSTCWQCVSRDGIVGFVEGGRLVKIEGNPEVGSSRGKLCARGQAGVNQVYHPDRLLHPLKRVGARGEGRWKRVSWDEALELLVEGGDVAGRRVRGLRTLREAGTPEKLLFHYGRTVGSDWLILMAHFLPAYGTGSVGDHNSICMSAGGMAGALTPGSRHGFSALEDARIVLNFGGNPLEADTRHLPMSQRWMDAQLRGTRTYTFDVRLSNTAARSTEWVPVRPATDLAVALALCHEILAQGLHDRDFIERHTNVTVAELESHLAPHTAEWAEGISGVPAARIRAIAREYGTTKPGVVTSFRGAFMHHNGVETQRALYMLEAITGNVDPRGGADARRPRWRHPFPYPPRPARSLDVFEGEKGAYAFPAYKVSHQILRRIEAGPERPEIYLVYCHNPVYSNGDCRDNARILRDVEKVPFLVTVDVALSETSELADLVLPDATYLERWATDGKVSPEGVPEYLLRQPMHPPLGEARDFCDVACTIAERLGLDLGFSSAEEFVRASCEATPGIREAGGFEYMKRHGVWSDPGAGSEPVPGSETEGLSGYWKTGRYEIRSDALEKKGFPALPSWMPVPEHEAMAADELVLTTFKVAVQTHSRTQGCKWLSELYHDNPAWLHPRTAAARGIADGDAVRVRSALGEIVTRARVTEAVHPGAVAISFHCGHWASGEYASGVPSHVHEGEPDSRLRWWRARGEHPNLVIPNRGDPIAGSMCWNDTVVRVTKA